MLSLEKVFYFSGESKKVLDTSCDLMECVYDRSDGSVLSDPVAQEPSDLDSSEIEDNLDKRPEQMEEKQIFYAKVPPEVEIKESLVR